MVPEVGGLLVVNDTSANEAAGHQHTQEVKAKSDMPAFHYGMAPRGPSTTHKHIYTNKAAGVQLII